MTEPRILMVIALFYPCLGGTEQQALNLSRGLASRGIAVSVLTRALAGLPAYQYMDGFPVYRSIRVIPRGKWFGLSYMLSVTGFLLRMRRTYDIIHCHLAHGLHAPAALLIKKLLNKKVIIKTGATGALSDYATLRAMAGGRLLLNMLRSADRIIAVCNQAAHEAREAGIPRDRILRIPNGVDISRFRPGCAGTLQRHITFIGRLDGMKGIDILLQAFARLKTAGSQACLQIIGDGPDRPRLQEAARDFNLAECVSFHGEQSDIGGFLRNTAAFVLPSFSEGLSNVLLEAMACGLPVVATNVGGNPDLVQDNINGLLVEPRSPEALYKALKILLEDSACARRLGEAARATVVKHFSLESVVDHYIDLYRALSREG